MDEFNPDNWDIHWTNSEEAASSSPAQVYRHRLVTRIVRRYKPKRLVDIGCGQGDLLKQIGNSSPHVQLMGVELSQTGVEITREKNPQAQVYQMNLLDGSSTTSHIGMSDMGTCIEVLEHLDHPHEFLRNAASLLDPGGILVVSVPSGPRTAFDKHIGHRRHYTPRSLRELLMSSGFHVEEVKRCGWPFFNLYRFIVLLRGEKLVQEVSSQSINDSKLASLVSRTFNVLCKFNLPIRFLGWQLIAVCRKAS